VVITASCGAANAGLLALACKLDQQQIQAVNQQLDLHA
jgi:hypothetical protein